ncbi:putative transcription factor btf3 [Emericellopsis atlantica]|uniref:Transcription factor btf3 n=1 Tax=Emericellopsis atlantica TaxID=2614577 RepID=A0A9P7ZT80_9HYPO|nr:putative transcription factor btf3 [Emericellopsis atlantica]KAG9257830.1 putative transcription factor btf3 [Emericellopsis atlantica]
MADRERPRSAQAPGSSDGREQNPHASASKWRHQESSAFAKHAAQHAQQAADARESAAAGRTSELADFINKSSRVEPPAERPVTAGGGYKPVLEAAGHAKDGAKPEQDAEDGRGEPSDGKEIVCGPLLNYRRMERGRWYGSVLIVIKGGGPEVLFKPSLVMRRVGAAGGQVPAVDGQANGGGEVGDEHEHGGMRFESQRLYSDARNTFWAFDIDAPIEATEVQYEYSVPEMRFNSQHKPRTNNFFIPAENESMRIMFHSCNGFSVGTDEDAWSGAALWNDVIRQHQAVPYHVMLGGGDQIYNDGIRVDGPLYPWANIGNPQKRRDYPFPEKLRAECDDYYLKNYIRWYNTEPFSSVNGQIAQVNIWDDHDIIDGFGSYTDHFMRCDVFRGIGGVAHKYYMLFQHHLPPPASTYTTDTAALTESTQGPDPNQMVGTFVAEPKSDPSYIVGKKPGPYVAEHSFNIFTRLGARMALMGIDARVERTRHQINYPETYDLIFKRVYDELRAAAASDKPITHLIVLLGIPIAYPRLTWLENVLRSPLAGPMKLMHKRFGLGGALFNQFDGNFDLLDDLDDHYTARVHKAERSMLIHRLQEVGSEFSCRVTILGGDVHLAALGRFYSNPKLKIPVEQDHRYIANVVSSAIVNKPPPQAVANLLAKRNKIHHLDHDTDETLLDLFNKDPGDSTKTAGSNHCTMPSRNFASITENSPNNQPLAGANGETTNVNGGASETNGEAAPQSFIGKDGHSVLHQGEVGSGTKHKAASVETHGRGNDGSLDVRINIEIDPSNRQGLTEGYGLSIPLLAYQKPTTPASAAPASSSVHSAAH